MIFIVLKTTGDDGSDITGCMLAISTAGLTEIQKYDRVADELSNAHLCFNAVSFTVNSDSASLTGVDVFWLTDNDWEDKFKVGADDGHVFINRRNFERLKKTANPDWSISLCERIVFNQFGDCFIQGSYDGANGNEESAMLPISEIEQKFSK